MKPRYQIQDAKRKGGVLTNFLPGGVLTNAGMQSLPATSQQPQTTPRVATPQVTIPKINSIPTKKAVKSWEVCLSESSGSENETENVPSKPKIKEITVCDKKEALREHDYCWEIYKMLKEEDKKEELSEMDKILSIVAMGAFEIPTQPPAETATPTPGAAGS